MNLNELLVKSGKMSHEERVADATSNVADLRAELKGEGYREKDINEILLLLTRLAVDSDNYASEEEYEIFDKAVGLNLPLNEFLVLVKRGNEEDFFKIINDTVDALSPKAKALAIDYVVDFLVSDKKLKDEERNILLRLAA